MSLKTISPKEAKRLIDQGAVLVDIRGTDEHARERIPGARNVPVDSMGPVGSKGRLDGETGPVVFHCKSGNRTSVNAGKLAAAAACEAYVVEGGIEGWKSAGFPVVKDESQPLEIMRQVQLTAGALVLLGVILSQTVAPALIGLSAFVGAGLMFAGATGWCGMARLLSSMPWNRRGVTRTA